MEPSSPIGGGRERVESAAEKWHDDDLSLVASDEGSSTDGHMSVATEDKSRKTAPIDLVRGETQAVSYLRYLILFLMVTSCIFMSWGTFRWVKKAENADLSSGYDDDGSSCASNREAVQDSFAQVLEGNLKQAHTSRLTEAFTLSASFTSFVSETLADAPRSWPMVSIPHFEPRLTGILHTTGATQVRLAPFVEPALRLEFEAYAVEQQKIICTSGCTIVGEIYNVDAQPLRDDEVTSPIWQVAPFTSEPLVLRNQFGDLNEAEALRRMQDLSAGVWTDLRFASTEQAPTILLFYPIFADFQQVQMVGSLSMELEWFQLLNSSVPFGLFDEEMSILVQSCTNQTLSFSVADANLIYAGTSPGVPTEVQEEAVVFELSGAYVYGEFEKGMKNTADACGYKIWVVPKTTLESFLESGSVVQADETASNLHIFLTSVVAVLYFVMILVFLIYDWLVEKRQSVVVNIATKSSAIVDNLFPAQVRDRMLQNMVQQGRNPKANGDNDMNGDSGATPVGGNGVNGDVIPSEESAPNQVSVKQFLGGTNEPYDFNDLSTAPIADLFPNTTVLFADIAGFTAWSSQREPPQVFTLLETLYRSFDVIAAKLKVFKVETIGDCYMAVTGLPNPDAIHAVHMSRFAYQCLIGMKELIRELEAVLGPGTSDLALRTGLHSGAVTAGVLRGEKSRFQLFGDTVNTASRMESTGERGRIQVSQETADLLMAAGKAHWLKPRDEKVVAKGKGEMKTYWLDPTKKRRTAKNHKDIRVAQEISLNNKEHVDKPMSPADAPLDDKYARLIDWNVDVLLHHLARVISSRSRSPSRGSLVNHSSEVALLPAAINDVAEVVALPPFDPDASRFRRARPDVSMLQQTRADLHEYVKRIAMLYRDVPFHNFEHASHVTLCANKLLNRLINSDEYDTELKLHDSTFGISSDPLTHFAIVFAALIHDADHHGLPNAQLVKTGHELATKFDMKSVAEQNSVHLGWEMLMDPRFERLRKCIYQTNVERKRFRQLVINSVMATDIADRQVNEDRQMKWDRAFRGKLNEEATGLQIQEDMNRKATAVIEHIIQVSDVAHTMQHWHIYRRWNERLFHEMHEAYQGGKVGVDPSTNWYVGELGFFDYYLIPLAVKLKECGVFGASGYEYISYVLKNKKEWERKGRQVVQEMVLLYKDVEDEDHSGSSFDSEDYDSDGLEYDSPGDMSSDDDDTSDPDNDSVDTDSVDAGQIK
jgi:class 3 adenylate cyclase